MICHLPAARFADSVAASPQTQARLRLQAAVSLLHLACVEKYATEVALSLPAIAVTIQVTITPCLMRCAKFIRVIIGSLLSSPYDVPGQVACVTSGPCGTKASGIVQRGAVSVGARS